MQHLTPTEAAACEAEATIYRAQAAAREAQFAARKTQLAAAVAALRAEHPELEALAKAAFGEIEGVWPSDQPWWRAVCENSIKRLK